MTVRRENEISRVILDAAIEVHSVLARPGLLEGVYEEAIAYELALRGLAVERQKAVPGIYKGQRRGSGIGPALEPPRRGHGVGGVPATTAYNKVFEAQALTCLRLLDLKLALVINFGEHLVKDGVHRVVNGR